MAFTTYLLKMNKYFIQIIIKIISGRSDRTNIGPDQIQI